MRNGVTTACLPACHCAFPMLQLTGRSFVTLKEAPYISLIDNSDLASTRPSIEKVLRTHSPRVKLQNMKQMTHLIGIAAMLSSKLSQEIYS
jgi:hypothetical protein